MMYPFTFKVRCLDLTSDNERVYIQNGMGFCSNYANAASQIEELYGSELICIERIYLIEEQKTRLIVLPEEICKTYEEEIAPYSMYEEGAAE